MNKAYEETTVPAAKSKEKIEALLKKQGVVAIRFTSFPSYALLEFVRQTGEQRIPYRIVVKPKVRPYGNPGKELDRAERQVWRVVYWWLKSKVEAIDFGLVEFEQDFLPYMLLANQEGESATVSEIAFQALAGRIGSSDNPFQGLHPALPSGEKE